MSVVLAFLVEGVGMGLGFIHSLSWHLFRHAWAFFFPVTAANIVIYLCISESFESGTWMLFSRRYK